MPASQFKLAQPTDAAERKHPKMLDSWCRKIRGRNFSVDTASGFQIKKALSAPESAFWIIF
jgi:hypothetical protein